MVFLFVILLLTQTLESSEIQSTILRKVVETKNQNAMKGSEELNDRPIIGIRKLNPQNKFIISFCRCSDPRACFRAGCPPASPWSKLHRLLASQLCTVGTVWWGQGSTRHHRQGQGVLYRAVRQHKRLVAPRRICSSNWGWWLC